MVGPESPKAPSCGTARPLKEPAKTEPAMVAAGLPLETVPSSLLYDLPMKVALAIDGLESLVGLGAGLKADFRVAKLAADDVVVDFAFNPESFGPLTCSSVTDKENKE